MARLDWRRCKKAGGDGSTYDPFRKKRPWQDPDRWGYKLMSLGEAKRELARLRRELAEPRRELARLRREMQA